MSTHTPGPWVIASRHQTWSDEANDLVDTDEVMRIEGAGGAHVCGTCDGCNKIKAADADLIIAAPGLLEAAEHLFVCTFPDEKDFKCEGCNKARAAIEKARGGS